jgi:general stress protein 26
MSQTEYSGDDGEVTRLLAGASNAIVGLRHCWLVTEAEHGGSNARPMGRVVPDADESDWVIRFIGDRRSRKASDIRRAGKVSLIFQHDRGDAFVALSGRATLIEIESEVRRLWRDAYDAYVPAKADRANVAIVQVDVERMELWIRGVTREPFGLRPTILERDAGGIWHLISGEHTPQ